MVKVAVTNDNDILYNSLSNAFLQNELNIELIKVPYEKLEQISKEKNIEEMFRASEVAARALYSW